MVLISATAVIGCLFRVACYIFLQVIPTRLAKPVLPALYILSFIGSFVALRKKNSTFTQESKKDADHRQPISSVSLFSLILSIVLCVPSSRRAILGNCFINLLLFVAVLDFALSPYLDSADNVVFTRIGAVYPDSVKIVVRYPFNFRSNESLHILWREASPAKQNGDWNEGPVVVLAEASDWVGTVKLDNLWPSTVYEYTLSDTNQTILPYPPKPIRFSTFPDPRLSGGRTLNFIVSSCITPNFPYRGPRNRRLIHGFDLLAEHIHVSNYTTDGTEILNSGPHFLLFLGDFIYADVPIYFGDEKEAYRRLYRRNYQSPSFRKVYETLPIFHTYDDHEIIDNFVGEIKDEAPYPNAADAFKLYNTNANYDPLHAEQLYYEFQRGDVAFFVMDTRRYRSRVDGPDFTTRSMLGERQLLTLLDWLTKVNNTAAFKFVVSSVPFTTLWSHDAQFDSWAGFPKERQLLLDAFHSVPNVVVLSGDRHEFAVIEFSGEDSRSYPVYEVSTSPLNMFYIPFVRTLASRSQEFVIRNVSRDDLGQETGVVYFEEEVPKEKVIKYIPAGNSKWSSISINTTDSLKPLLHLETFIDGKSAYNLTVEGKPVRKAPWAAVGLSITSNIIDVFRRFGFIANRWL